MTYACLTHDIFEESSRKSRWKLKGSTDPPPCEKERRRINMKEVSDANFTSFSNGVDEKKCCSRNWTLGRATEVYFPLCYRAKWTREGGYLRGLLLCVTLSSFFHQDRRFPSRILEEFSFFFRIKISYFAWKICDEIVPREVGGNRWRVSRVNVRGWERSWSFCLYVGQNSCDMY